MSSEAGGGEPNYLQEKYIFLRKANIQQKIHMGLSHFHTGM